MRTQRKIVLTVVLAVMLVLISVTSGVSAQTPGIPLPLRVDVNAAGYITPNHLFGVAGQNHQVSLNHNMLDGDAWLAVNNRSRRIFNWGDGTMSLYSAGQVASHIWQLPGFYIVRCELSMAPADGGATYEAEARLAMTQIEQRASGFMMNAGDSRTWSVPGQMIVGVLIYDTWLSRANGQNVCLMVNGTEVSNLCLSSSDGAVGIGNSFEFLYMTSTLSVGAVVAQLVGKGVLEVRGRTVLYYVPSPVSPEAKNGSILLPLPRKKLLPILSLIR